MRILITFLISLLICTAANAQEFALKSSTFKNNEMIPVLYTCNGQNISPPLFWEHPPANTQAFALILYSPDTPMGTLYLWVLYNIPNTVKSLSAGEDLLPEGTLLGTNSLDETTYRGPCPPDDALHHYTFVLYALDAKLDSSAGTDYTDIISQIKHHEIKHAELTGVFRH